MKKRGDTERWNVAKKRRGAYEGESSSTKAKDEEVLEVQNKKNILRKIALKDFLFLYYVEFFFRQNKTNHVLQQQRVAIFFVFKIAKKKKNCCSSFLLSEEFLFSIDVLTKSMII